MATRNANKGKSLELLIEAANNRYDADGLALIQKIATPVKVVRNGPQIVSAYYEKKSTVDFSGVIAGGYPVAFDCKQTKNLTSFNINSIEPHQMEYLNKFAELGGIAFVIVEFTETKEIYRLGLEYIKLFMFGGHKSIKLSHIRNDCHLCSKAGTNPLDYLRKLNTF